MNNNLIEVMKVIPNQQKCEITKLELKNEDS